jgi:hypothetical protein
MRTKLCLFLTGLACGIVFVLMPADAAEDRKGDEELIPVVYPIADLPVWMHQSDDFNPTLLIDYLKLAVDPESWDRGSIATHPRTSALVILQTQRNHQMVAEVLIRLRRDHPGEQPYEIKEPGVTHSLPPNPTE